MAELLLLNPRRRRRKHKAVKSRKRVHRRLKAAFRRKRRHRARAVHRMRRRRSLVVVGKSNPVRRKRRFRLRHYSPNPINSPMGFVKQTLVPSAVGAGGALGLDVLLGFATPYLPDSVTSSPIFRPMVRIAGAVGLGMLATKVVGRKMGEQIAAGAITVTVYDVLKGLVKSVAPTLALGENDYTAMGYYSPGMQVGNEEISGMGQYVEGLGEYVE